MFSLSPDLGLIKMNTNNVEYSFNMVIAKGVLLFTCWCAHYQFCDIHV